ncbi:MAG: molybdenum cofactor guanylyltransferase [Desulfovibrio sp.]|nr:molybdenum cofactor guanylyltransferase [Desulfovibrio sp.]
MQQGREQAAPRYPDILGIILAGGLSSRMGQNKALLTLENGITFLERTWQLLGLCVDSRLLVTRSNTFSARYSCLEDACERHGPVGGIFTALRFARDADFSAVLALACDMPFLNLELLRRLLAAHARRKQQTLLTAYTSHGRIEGLCAVYAREALPYFEAALAHGEYSLYAVIPQDRMQCLAVSESEDRALYNVNTPDDLALVRKKLGSDQG